MRLALDVVTSMDCRVRYGVVRMRVMHETCCSNHGIFCVTWG